eukprot:c28095_g1_i1 orf=376-2871(-)
MDREGVLSIQLVSGDGTFDEVALGSFVKDVRLSECGLSYAVVSIMGPQSSGKSTLLNHLFHTNFREMDAFKGRNQTTQGIWLANAAGIDPCTLVMDLEGTDGRERGEDDTAFEKQSALFALAVSDIVLINMWCHDIGREQAANKPLLKTVFQVMMRLFTPRKSTLLFVIRDKTKTPLEVLEPILREDVQKIWDAVPKPVKHQHSPLSEFFNVEITALPSYEEKEDQFLEQVSLLRQRFFNSIAPGGLAGDRRAVVPGSGFPLSSQGIWKVIKDNKDLDLPAHTVMVATVRCEEIAYEKLTRLASDEEWQTLEEDSKAGPIPNFGKKLNNVLDKLLLGYDSEAAFFDEVVRTSKRQMMLSKALDILNPAYQAVLGHHRSTAYSRFKHNLEVSADTNAFASSVHQCTEACMAEFDQGCVDAHVQIAGWNSLKIREKLRRDIEVHAATVRADRLAKISDNFEKRLEHSLAEPVASLLDASTPSTWQAIRRLLAEEIQLATSELSVVLAGFQLEKEEELAILRKLGETGRHIVEKKAKEEAGQALIRIKNRFNTVFSHDTDSMPRVWTGKEDIKAIIRTARLSALKLLAVLAALRLDDKRSDNIELALMSLLNTTEAHREGGVVKERSLSSSTTNQLASNTWEGVPSTETLITPVQCSTLWRQFRVETEYTISQALSAQEASRRSASWLPPPWAIIAMIVLGFNEFMTLLRNPLYLGLLFVLWLLGRAVWVQLDISREFQNGFLPGIISVSSKLLPTFMNILKKLAEEGQQFSGHRDSDNSTVVSGDRSTTLQYKEVPLQDMTKYASSNESSSMNGHDFSSSQKHRQQAKVSYSS